MQIHRHDKNTWILRQSLCTHFEAPFVYLLFGRDLALLEDTGAGASPIGDAVNSVIDIWLEENARDSIELVVVNSHAHGDHTAGNAQFRNQANTRLIAPTVTTLSEAFSLQDWPNTVGTLDLGERSIEVIPIPGHEASHIALYDAQTGWLLTGDTLYPGRLYIRDFAAYRESITRLLTRMEERTVCQVMGTHIEMRREPAVDILLGSPRHENEHALELSLSHLVELDAALRNMPTPSRQVHDDFIITPL